MKKPLGLLFALTSATLLLAQNLPPPPSIPAVPSENSQQAASGSAAPGDTYLAPVPTINEILDGQAAPYSMANANIQTLFHGLGKTYKLNFSVDSGISGGYDVYFNGGTLRQLISQILNANDLYMQEFDGTLYVKRLKSVTYYINYPNINRDFKSSTNVSLSPPQSTAASTTTIGGATTTGTPTAAQQTTTGGNTGSNDSTSFTITEQAGDDFWKATLADIKVKQIKGEIISVNTNAGRATIETTLKRHAFWKEFFRDLNELTTAQVSLIVTVHELTLNDQNQLGFNWNQLQTALNNSGSTNFSLGTNTGFSTVAGAALTPATFTGTFATGKLASAINAMAQQGTMKLVTTATMQLLNNQKAYIKTGDDKTFFSLSQNTTISAPGLTSGVGTTASSSYSQMRETFGFITPVTVRIDHDEHITIILEPTRTQLNGTDVSPDGTQTAPDTNVESMSTIVRLKDNESTIIGGLAQNSKSTQTNGVPFLQNIPFIGALARTDAKITNSTELLVTISAHIIR